MNQLTPNQLITALNEQTFDNESVQEQTDNQVNNDNNIDELQKAKNMKLKKKIMMQINHCQNQQTVKMVFKQVLTITI